MSTWRMRSVADLLATVATLFAAGSFLGFIGNEFFVGDHSAELTVAISEKQAAFAKLETEIRRVRKENINLREQVSAQQTSGGVGEKPETAKLEPRLQALEASQNRIEAVVLQDPGKALSIPMLRRDIEEQKERTAIQLAAIKANVDQSYDLNKWLLGSMVLSILGIAVSNVLASRSNRNE